MDLRCALSYIHLLLVLNVTSTSDSGSGSGSDAGTKDELRKPKNDLNADEILLSRIVGGTPVMESNERYPWFVKFRSCGGMLVAPMWGTCDRLPSMSVS